MTSVLLALLLQHTVSRVGLLDQAEKLIGELGSSQSVLEIQYEGEVSNTPWLHALVLLYVLETRNVFLFSCF